MNKETDKAIIAEALGIEAEDAQKKGALCYMTRALIQATLPHKRVSGAEFVRRNGDYTLSITTPSALGLPYGVIPRLLLSWLTTEVVFRGNRLIVLGPSLSHFMHTLGYAVTGGKNGTCTHFHKQAVSLFWSTFNLINTGAEKYGSGPSFQISTDRDLYWNPKQPNQATLWKSAILISQEFLDTVKDSSIPADMNALRALKRSPMAIDAYWWLTYRMFTLSKITPIPWPLLQLQFGADYPTTTRGKLDFKRQFLLHLKKVLEIYKTAKVDYDEKSLILYPSPPHVPSQPMKFIPQRNGTEWQETPFPLSENEGKPIDLGAIRLNPETYEKARKAAPKYDVHSLEMEWREWSMKKGTPLKDPDGAFIGFCKTKHKARPLV